jgi:hypothetical protein
VARRPFLMDFHLGCWLLRHYCVIIRCVINDYSFALIVSSLFFLNRRNFFFCNVMASWPLNWVFSKLTCWEI